MLLGVILKHPDFLLETGLHQGHGSEIRTTSAFSLVLDRTDEAQTDRVVGDGHVGPRGLLHRKDRNIIELLNILNQPRDYRNSSDLIQYIKSDLVNFNIIKISSS